MGGQYGEIKVALFYLFSKRDFRPVRSGIGDEDQRTLESVAEEVGFDKWLISLIFRHSSPPVNLLYVTGRVAAIRAVN